VREIGLEVRLRQRGRVADVLGIIRNSHNLDDSGPDNRCNLIIRRLIRNYHEYESYDRAIGDIDTGIQHTHMALVTASEPPHCRNSMQ
jgi:hypothetical protein